MNTVIYTKPLRLPDDMPGRTTDSIEVTYDNGEVISVKKVVGNNREEIMKQSVTIDVDQEVIEGSENPISGGAVYNGLSGKADGSVYTTYKDNNNTVAKINAHGVALGTETVVNGEDQFVFGRVNDEDNSKVEIVGNGKMMPYNSSYRYHDWKNENNFSFCAYKIGETKQEVEQYLSVARGSQVTIQNWNDNIKSVYRYQNNPGIYILVDVSSDDLKDGDSTYLVYVNSDTPSFSGTGSALSMYDLQKKVLAYSDSYYKDYKLYAAPEYLKGELTYVREGANIRTLDWEGNEKLAGGLEIGGILKIGSTTITEAQLQELLKIITESEPQL